MSIGSPVVNASGFEVFSPEHSVSGYEIRPVELLEVEMDLQEGRAELRWTRFTGARFEAYEVLSLQANAVIARQPQGKVGERLAGPAGPAAGLLSRRCRLSWRTSPK